MSPVQIGIGADRRLETANCPRVRIGVDEDLLHRVMVLAIQCAQQGPSLGRRSTQVSVPPAVVLLRHPGDERPRLGEPHRGQRIDGLSVAWAGGETVESTRRELVPGTVAGVKEAECTSARRGARSPRGLISVVAWRIRALRSAQYTEGLLN